MKMNEPRNIGCVALVTASILSMFFMWHHPEIGSHDVQGQIAEINHKAFSSRIVHGVLIALLLPYCLGFMQFVQSRKTQGGVSNIALLSFVLGCSLMVGAALISGFIIPAVASSYIGAGDTELIVFKAIQRLSWHSNQALANTGTIAWLVAIILWSLTLVREVLIIKVSAVLFSITAAVTLLFFVLGLFSLNVAGMTFVVFLLAAFSLYVAYLMGAKKI